MIDDLAKSCHPAEKRAQELLGARENWIPATNQVRHRPRRNDRKNTFSVFCGIIMIHRAWPPGFAGELIKV
jgi:hypothetical protein